VTEYENILVDRRGKVGIITLNRPHALNALNSGILGDVLAATSDFDRDRGIGAIVLTGSDKAFAAGADIKEMSTKSFVDVNLENFFSGWDDFQKRRTPVIAAVSGYALGGGCELAMMCDIILASESAKFGQPEITLGVIPGMGGSQRLTRAIGVYKAKELVLTGRLMGAEEAERAGLVSRIVSGVDLVEEAIAVATTIAAKSLPVIYAAKEAVDVALESTLAEGLRFERRVMHSMFALDDQTEGMTAFAQKREPRFTDS